MDSWRIRRRVVVLALAVCAAGVIYLTFGGEDTRLNETLALGYFGLAGSVIGCYVFGAVLDDNNMAKAASGSRKPSGGNAARGKGQSGAGGFYDRNGESG